MSMFFFAGIGLAGVLAWLTGRDTKQRLVTTVLLTTGIGGYSLVGAPDNPAQPLTGRLDELAGTDPEGLEPQALIAMRRVQAGDTTPQSMTALGDALIRAGQLDEAAVSYRSALRVDSSHAPAMRGLADIIALRRNGMPNQQAMHLYRAAAAIDPKDIRSGFMIGVGLWQSGLTDAARTQWDATLALMDADDPARHRLDQLRQRIETGR